MQNSSDTRSKVGIVRVTRTVDVRWTRLPLGQHQVGHHSPVGNGLSLNQTFTKWPTERTGEQCSVMHTIETMPIDASS
jgi:hypothetical protein